MCGRYVLIKLNEMIQRFGWHERGSTDLVDRYNIAPTQLVPAFTAEKGGQLDFFAWGLVPGWAKDPSIGSKMINARSETVQEKPAFKNAFKRRRCLIPASGFYEWKNSGDAKTPMYITLKDTEPFTFAGLWESWHDDKGNQLRTCTILTMQANDFMQQFHDRMPVIMPEKSRQDWLNLPESKSQQAMNLVQPFPASAFDAIVVSTRVNSVKNDSRINIEPAEKETLF